jgi:AraC-like DNA-binding protein
MRGNDYSVNETFEESTSNENFVLHDHDSYEILLFLDGDSKFVIEGKNYFLEPGDLIIVRKHEMHRVYHNSNAGYHRIVLMVTPNFFIRHNCPNYEKQFLDFQMGIANRIKSNYVHSCGLYDAFMRLKRYSQDYRAKNEPVLEAIVMEILFLISQTGRFSDSDTHGNQVEKIISYINNHYTEPIKLQELTKHCFISKSYLCKIFPQTTGLTVHDYINRKRLNKVRELREKGKSIGEAAMLSGFSDYSSFYRTYKKLMGCAPKENVTRFNMGS